MASLTPYSVSTIFGDFYNFDGAALDELDSGTGTHPGSLKLHLNLKMAHRQCLLSQMALKSAREDGQRRAQRTSRHARRGRNAPRLTSLRPEALLFKGSKTRYAIIALVYGLV
ncbi:hypothetical protein V8E54_004429 [Elaphomyces granulatus]